ECLHGGWHLSFSWLEYWRPGGAYCAGLVASRGRCAGALASLAGCPAELILDALTIELTGRFIGRIRERDEQILKHQPIV
ncbi:MAG: hypothetical protein ABSD87_12335, partial [Candidatus Acidiferrales bacterium]